MALRAHVLACVFIVACLVQQLNADGCNIDIYTFEGGTTQGWQAG
jgi:hypothetical protein